MTHDDKTIAASFVRIVSAYVRVRICDVARGVGLIFVDSDDRSAALDHIILVAF